ncbi:MAG: ComF family protein [Eubacteriales bacterium]|nr:ComF family protein [Eubacteriales bacterium]
MKTQTKISKNKYKNINNIKKIVKATVIKIINLIYPKDDYCICCDSFINSESKYHICDSCIRKLQWINNVLCEKCGKMLDDEITGEILCYDCQENMRSFDKAYTCTRYGLYERILISRFKEHKKSYIAESLATIMYDRICLEYSSSDSTKKAYDVVIPIPIHKNKYKKRGFNQSENIAKVLAEKLGVLYDKNLLKREIETRSMKSLSSEERKRNIKNAFIIETYNKNLIKYNKVLLVDDIYTTGATLNEASRVLKEAGVREVYAITFSAGANRIPIN